MNKNNKSGFTGVYFDKNSNKFRAQISIANKKIKLGYFSNINDAVFAREKALDLYKSNLFNLVNYAKVIYNLGGIEGTDNTDVDKINALWGDAIILYFDKNKQSNEGFLSFALNHIKENKIEYFKSTQDAMLFVEKLKSNNFVDKKLIFAWANGILSFNDIANIKKIPVYCARKLVFDFVSKVIESD